MKRYCLTARHLPFLTGYSGRGRWVLIVLATFITRHLRQQCLVITDGGILTPTVPLLVSQSALICGFPVDIRTASGHLKTYFAWRGVVLGDSAQLVLSSSAKHPSL
ncbi:hypothetical protein TWF594_000225 [Orbilia oligospora]|nr:hypothetical protein TWF594_000225 [Orbilia oligospora]